MHMRACVRSSEEPSAVAHAIGYVDTHLVARNQEKEYVPYRRPLATSSGMRRPESSPINSSSLSFASLSCSPSFASSRLLKRSWRSSFTSAVRLASTISARYFYDMPVAISRGTVLSERRSYAPRALRRPARSIETWTDPSGASSRGR